MNTNAKIKIALSAILLIAAASILFFARVYKEKLMQEKTVPISEQMTVQLPRPNFESSTSIEKALRERRSHRDYGEGSLSLEEIAQLLWAAQGISHNRYLRTAPSAGALYPVETYLVAGEVQNLPAGVYRYQPHRHALVLTCSGDVRRQLCSVSLHQEAISSAPACIAFSAVYARSTVKYGKRGIRYTHMEAGIAAQNVSLQAVSLNLGTVVIGSFDDDEVRDVLALPAGEDPLLIMPVGKVLGIPSRP